MKRPNRRYLVIYNLAYDGGGSQWVGTYPTRLLARLAMLYNLHIASWGGTAKLVDTRREVR